MKKPHPRPLPTTRKRPEPAVPRQRSGPPPSPQPEPARKSHPRMPSPPRVPLPQVPSTRAVTYSRTRTLRELRHHAFAERVVLVAAVTALIGSAYFAWQDGGARSEVRSSGWYVMANPPAQLPRTGSYVDSRILPNGDVRVEYWVRTRTPMREIELVVPRGEGPGGAPRATDVDVAAEQFEVSDGKVVGSSTVYPLDYPSRIVRVRYTLVGAVVRSPSAPGRALARFTSADLVSMPEEDGPRMVRIRAPEVLNVACRAPSQEASPRPCGSQAGTSWQVELHGADRADEVSAQVNLKTP
jgi:hypothetical protein